MQGIHRIPLNDVDETPNNDSVPSHETDAPPPYDECNTGVHAEATLPCPPGDRNARNGLTYPPTDDKASFLYPSQGASNTYPPTDDNTSLSYPPQGASNAYPPTDDKASLAYPTQLNDGQGQASEGYAGGHLASPPPIQFDSGNDIPPPPSYDDIDLKKKL
jgi:hypothetical protein